MSVIIQLCFRDWKHWQWQQCFAFFFSCATILMLKKTKEGRASTWKHTGTPLFYHLPHTHAYSLYSSRYGNFTMEDTLTVIKASQQTAAPSQTCRQVFPQERGNDAPEGGEAGRKWQKIGDAELTTRQTQECGALELFISLFPFPGRTHHTPTTPLHAPTLTLFSPHFCCML